MRGLAAALVFAAAIAAGACGESRGGGATATTTPRTAPRPGERAVVVSLTDYRLEPSHPRVGRSGEIRFDVTNDGGVEHALAVNGPSGRARTRVLAPGERVVLRLALPVGTFKWLCPLADHEELGMAGRIRVGG